MRIHVGSVVLALALTGAVGGPARGDDIRDYAAECNNVIKASVEEFSCLDGAVLGMDGKEGETCDNPPLLRGSGCYKYSRLGERNTGNPDVSIVFLCRHKNKVANDVFSKFADIAVIQTDHKTGATCFYQALSPTNQEELDGARVPKPDSVDGAAFWMPPSKMKTKENACAQCHDNGPFLRSPYVMQVPLEAFSSTNRNKSEYFFAADSLLGWNGKVFRMVITGNPGSSCTGSCHKMGASSIDPDDRFVGTGQWMGQLSTGASATPYHRGTAESAVWMSLSNRGRLDDTNQAHSSAVRDCAIAKKPDEVPGCERKPWGGQVEDLLKQIEVLSRQVDGKRR
jgi:hypothetical protein